jgi:hypothetical protein
VNRHRVLCGFGTLFGDSTTWWSMTSEETRADLREQLTTAFDAADYPVDSQMDLVPALPQGPGTRFESGDVSFTAMELAAKLGGEQEFPYDDVEELVDDIMAGLETQGML